MQPNLFHIKWKSDRIKLRLTIWKCFYFHFRPNDFNQVNYNKFVFLSLIFIQNSKGFRMYIKKILRLVFLGNDDEASKNYYISWKHFIKKQRVRNIEVKVFDQYLIITRFLFNGCGGLACDTTKNLMSSPKCRSVEVINNPARSGSNHREVNCINYK